MTFKFIKILNEIIYYLEYFFGKIRCKLSGRSLSENPSGSLIIGICHIQYQNTCQFWVWNECPSYSNWRVSKAEILSVELWNHAVLVPSAPTRKSQNWVTTTEINVLALLKATNPK